MQLWIGRARGAYAEACCFQPARFAAPADCKVGSIGWKNSAYLLHGAIEVHQQSFNFQFRVTLVDRYHQVA